MVRTAATVAMSDGDLRLRWSEYGREGPEAVPV